MKLGVTNPVPKAVIYICAWVQGLMTGVQV